VTVLSKSITPYQFSSEGMIKAASRQQPQHHYRVSSGLAGGGGMYVRHVAAHPGAMQLHSRRITCTPPPKVSEHDIFVIKTLGRGASSVVSKGFLVKDAKFVALKKINILQKVGGWWWGGRRVTAVTHPVTHGNMP
jgi:hypothetical protein